MELDVDGTTFKFVSDWQVSKYDDWTFHRKKMMLTEAKAVDLVAISPDKILFLVEVKDYTNPETESIPLDQLPLTIAAKCRDTLGGLVAARLCADGHEQTMAKAALAASNIRVVLHVRLPSKGGRLSDPRKVAVDLRQKLRAKLKAIDPHAFVETQDITFTRWETRKTPLGAGQ